jgi:hypothetical protein
MAELGQPFLQDGMLGDKAFQPAVDLWQFGAGLLLAQGALALRLAAYDLICICCRENCYVTVRAHLLACASELNRKRV